MNQRHLETFATVENQLGARVPAKVAASAERDCTPAEIIAGGGQFADPLPTPDDRPMDTPPSQCLNNL
jgi:hypothetical protein